MFETAGSLAIVQPSSLPILLVLGPLAWALAYAGLARARPRAARAASAACGVGTVVLVLIVAIRLARLPQGHVLVQHAGQIARLGQLDLAFDLALAPRDAGLALAAAVVGALSALGAARAVVGWARARVALAGVTTASAILVCAGDGLAPILIGLGGLALASWARGRGDGRWGVIALAGSGAALAVLVVLVGAVGGPFGGGGAAGTSGYERDDAARFVLVTTDVPSVDPTSATLAMWTYAGALVSSDDADLPGEPLASPFTISVPPGVHTLRVQPGVASDDVVVPHVALVAGKTHVLAPYGPTTSVRVARDQLAAPSLEPRGERETAPAARVVRVIDAVRAVALVLLFVLGGTLARPGAGRAGSGRILRLRGSRPARAVARGAAAIGVAVAFLSRSVRATDRVLLDAVPMAIARVARRMRPPSSCAGSTARAFHRGRTAALGAMAALLALLVLSPLVGRGPIELGPSGDAFIGELPIVNDGREPLVISRVDVRGGARDPRVPPYVSVRVTGGLPLTIPPGGSRTATVTWRPAAPDRARQLVGHVVVATSDARSREIATGVHADARGPLEARTLSLLLAVPLVGALLLLLVSALGRTDDRLAHRVAVGALAVQTALAARVFHGFVPDFARADGSGGLQLVERVVASRAIPIELYLGVDGVAVTALLTTSLVALLAVFADRAAPRVATGYHAALLLLEASVVGALVAMDGLVLLLFLAVAIATGAIVVATWGGAGRRAAAAALAGAGLVALAALAVALVVVGRHAGPTLLADGTAVARTFSLPDLSRADLEGATLFGGRLVTVAFALVFAASVVLLAAFPAHRWLAAVLVEAPPAAGILVASALPTLGACVLLRFGCAVLPDGARWASGVLVALGAVTAAYGALSALGRTELRTIVACTATAQSGFVLLGVGSLRAEGLSGAVVLGSTRALACGAVLVLAALMNARAGTTDLARLRGVGREAPGWTLALAIAALGHAGVLGLGGAWGPALALVGAVVGHAPFAIASALALIVLAAAHLAPLAEVAFGALDPAWRRSARLEPFGGRFPDATAREWTSVGPLVAIVLLLGVWPAPVASRAAGTVRDLAGTSWPPVAAGHLPTGPTA